MKNKYKKITVSIITILMLIFNISGIVFANSLFEGTIVDFGPTETPTGTDFVRHIVKTILTLIRVFAAGLAIIVITIMGTKYMAAAASEKAEIKNKLINYVIGIVLVAGATEIIAVAVDVFTSADLTT